MRKLLVLSVFKNCGLWVNDILTQMYKVCKYNESLEKKKRYDIYFSFLDGCSKDGTYLSIENFCREKKMNIQIKQNEIECDSRFKKLAKLRNYLVNESLSKFSIDDDDYILFTDSDIKFSEKLIHRLIRDMKKCEADIIAPMIYIDNFREFGNSYFYDVLAFRSLDGKNFNHLSPYLENFDMSKPNEVKSVGSFYIMKGKVLKNVKYSGKKDSEQYEFCSRARRRGYKIFVSPRLAAYHINFDDYGMDWH